MSTEVSFVRLGRDTDESGVIEVGSRQKRGGERKGIPRRDEADLLSSFSFLFFFSFLPLSAKSGQKA